MSTFQTARTLPVSAADIFAAMRQPERLARWWGPAGFSNTFDVFDFRPGGKWKFTMHGPDGAHYPNVSAFAEIIPDQKLVVRHASEPHFTLTITLSPAAAGTLVTWVQAFDSPAVAAAVRHIVEPANEQNLDRLTAEVVAGKSGG